MAGLLLLQAPLLAAFASVVVPVTQTVVIPVIAAGDGLTVITFVVWQPVVNE